MTMCIPMEKAIATSSQGLAHGGIVRREESSLRALSAFNISMTTRTERESVEAVDLPLAVK